MKKFIPVCVALLAIFATGESLICQTCGLSIGGKCLYRSSMFCPSSEPNCYWGKLAFNISRLTTMEMRGCLATSLCDTNQTGALLSVRYTVTRTCCNTDCCNGATSIQLPLTAALGATLMAIWSTRGL